MAIAALTLALSAPVLLTWSWSRPNAAPPTEMPPLTLAPAAVQAVLAADAAREEPTGEAAARRRQLYRETNVAEHDATDYPGEAAARRAQLAEALEAVIDEHGPDVVRDLRAADVQRGMEALHGELPADEVVAELGGFLGMMERYGMATAGHQTAPTFVVRTAFMARWNAVQGLELTDGFEPVQLRAYWGWLALHAANAPLDRRLEALDTYASAGGERALEARGVLLYDEGDAAGAAEAFRAAYAARGTFRLRNHALQASD